MSFNGNPLTYYTKALNKTVKTYRNTTFEIFPHNKLVWLGWVRLELG